jgi:hypothetical protein
MAQNIRTRRGKSAIQTRLEQERKASRKDPQGKRNVQKTIGTIASYAIPGGIATKLTPVVRKGIEKAMKRKSGQDLLKNYDKSAHFKGMNKFMRELKKSGKEDSLTYLKNLTYVKKDAKARLAKAEKGYKASLKFEKDALKSKRKMEKLVKRNKFPFPVSGKSVKRAKAITARSEKQVRKSKAKLAMAAKPVSEQRKAILKEYVVPEVKKVAKQIVGPAAGVITGTAMYKNKKSGGLTKTVPPKRGPNPQGLKNGGCPFRENGSKSPIKGISSIQIKGQKFIGTR